jgi:endonuclease YncB( thermonuclease family)
MRHLFILLYLAGIIVFSGCASVTDNKQQLGIAGHVTTITDGDTFKLKSGGKIYIIRIWGIDAPEQKQDWGSEATAALEKLIKDKSVRVERVDTDRWERLVCRVYCDRKYINLEMIKGGHAWWYKKYAPRAKDLEAAEQAAKAAKRGLWSKPNPVNPRTFRSNRLSIFPRASGAEARHFDANVTFAGAKTH